MTSWIPLEPGFAANIPMAAQKYNAVEGGYDGAGGKIYVGRGRIQGEGGLHVGKIHTTGNVCCIPFEGGEQQVENFEILSAPPGVRTSWVPGTKGQVPSNAVEGGHYQDGSKTYVGRIPFNGTMVPGEIVPNEEVCYISFMGKEEQSDTYEVLVMDAAAPAGVPAVAWVMQNGAFIPASIAAYEAGYDHTGAKLYVGRSLLKEGCHVGKVRSDYGTCYIPFEGGEHTFNEFQVLTAPYGVNLQWVPSSNGNVPPNAVEGGYNEDRSKTYVGRAQHNGSYSPGEVVPKDGLLYIAHEGEEKEFDQYEVLVLGPTGTNPSAPPY